MFSLRSTGLPADPVFPADLKKLGFHINENDQIRNLEFPEDPYRYKVNRNDRYNEVFNEAFNQCVRTEVFRRLESLNIKPLYLPQLTTKKPNEASMPILMTPPALLRDCRTVIVVNNSCNADLGIWSYRVAANVGTVATGSAISIVAEIINRSPSKDAVPGFILLNPGQPLYSYRAGRAMSNQSWEAQPRASAMHDAAPVQNINQIPSNSTANKHVDFVFSQVVSNPTYVNKDAEIYCIGREDGGVALGKYLDENWPLWSSRVKGLALAEPGLITPSDESFANFLRDRAMAWTLSHHPLNTPLANPDPETTPFPVRSGGEEKWSEVVMPTSFDKMLNFFEDIGKSRGTYRNPILDIPEKVTKEIEEMQAQQVVPTWGGDEEGEDINGGVQEASLMDAVRDSIGTSPLTA